MSVDGERSLTFDIASTPVIATVPVSVNARSPTDDKAETLERERVESARRDPGLAATSLPVICRLPDFVKPTEPMSDESSAPLKAIESSGETDPGLPLTETPETSKEPLFV